MKRLWVSFFIFSGVVSSLASQILLKDLFDNGDLATYANTQSQINGGFGIVGDGSGEVGEAGVFAEITNSSNKNNVYGMLSSGTVSLSGNPGETTLRTFWEIDNSVLKSAASRMAFTWQSDPALTATPEITLVLNLTTPQAELYIDSTNGVPVVVVDIDFDGDAAEGFTVETFFTPDSFSIHGGGALTRSLDSSPQLFSGSWSRSFSDYHVGAIVNANGQNGLVVDVDSVTVEAIPEPAALALIGIFGGGILLIRRFFAR